MITLTLSEVDKYLPREYPCNKNGLLQYFKNDAHREEEHREALNVVKKLITNRFKGKILIKDKTVEIRPIHVSITQPLERVWAWLKGMYGK